MAFFPAKRNVNVEAYFIQRCFPLTVGAFVTFFDAINNEKYSKSKLLNLIVTDYVNRLINSSRIPITQKEVFVIKQLKTFLFFFRMKMLMTKSKNNFPK